MSVVHLGASRIQHICQATRPQQRRRLLEGFSAYMGLFTHASIASCVLNEPVIQLRWRRYGRNSTVASRWSPPLTTALHARLDGPKALKESS